MNVVVIACNGLHLGYLGTYGNPWIHTPNLDRLAAQGVVFDHHFLENATTIPTRRSWWTGRYSFPDPDKGWTAPLAEETMLGDLLRDQGVMSMLVTDNPFLRDPATGGWTRGFDEVRFIRGAGYDPFIPPGDPRLGGVEPKLKDEPGFRLPERDDPDRSLWKTRWEQFLRNRAVFNPERRPEGFPVARTVAAACQCLERLGPRPDPFLLWIDLFAPHGPWDAPEAFRDRYVTLDPEDFRADQEGDLVDDPSFDESPEEIRALIDVPAGWVGDVISDAELLRLRKTYAGSVAFLDHCLGRLFETLESTGRTEDSLILFTADQGEPLGEHDFVRRYLPWLHEELIHTPLILRLPGAAEAGRRVDALTQAVDLAPTILSALGIRPPGALDEAGEADPKDATRSNSIGDADWDAPRSEIRDQVDPLHGKDLLPLARGRIHSVREFACMGMDAEEYAIRTRDWLLILPIDPDADGPPRPTQLYRKPEDRWERDNVAESHPEVVERLELTLRRFVAALPRDAVADVPPPRLNRDESE